MDHTKKELTCNQTRNVRTAFVSYSELNDKDTLFGGEIMSHFDSACGRAVFNFVKRPSFTATVDLIAFIQPSPNLLPPTSAPVKAASALTPS